MSETAKGNVLSSAARALSGLEIICRADAPVSLAQLASELGCSQVSAYRIAQTLIATGYVHAAGNGKGGYEAGWRIVELASPMLARNQLRSYAQPILRELAVRYDESITLAIPDGSSVLFVDRVSGPRTIEFFCDVGRRLPLHIGAASRAVLAHYPEDLFEQYVTGPLSRMTENTHVTEARLREDRQAILERGYAVSREDVEVGITGVAAVIKNRAGDVLGAAAIANISARWDQDEIEERGAVMVEACAQIGDRAALVTQRLTLDGVPNDDH